MDMHKARGKLIRAFLNPVKAISFAMALLRGQMYRFKFFILGRRVQVGRMFKVKSKIIIDGPGMVRIGDNVLVESAYGDLVSIKTYDKDAQVVIGNNVFLNGVKMRCQERIEIRDLAVLGDARIYDTDMHSVDIDRHSKDARVEVRPVVLGENTWICGGVFILKGVTIGKNSVVGAGSVVTQDVPENCLAAGNPVKIIKKIGA